MLDKKTHYKKRFTNLFLSIQIYIIIMTTSFYLEYKSIYIFITCAFILSFVLLAAVYLLSFTSKVDLEKSSAYECGFQPFSETSYPFEVQFAIIAIMFLLFDIEVLYLFPIVMSIFSLGFSQIVLLLGFYVILFVGLLYEMSRKVLDFQVIQEKG